MWDCFHIFLSPAQRSVLPRISGPRLSVRISFPEQISENPWMFLFQIAHTHPLGVYEYYLLK